MNDSPSTQSTSSILITGGTGFVGSHLVEALLSNKIDPKKIHLTSYSENDTFVNQLLPKENIHQLDLTQKEATFDLLEKIQPTQIYHLASIANVGGSFAMGQKILDNNVTLQFNLLEAVKTHIPKARVLIIGSAAEYDLIQDYPGFSPESVTETHPLGPSSPYAVSKTTQDLLAYSYHLSYDLQILRARPFNHIGERQRPNFAIAAFGQQIAKIEAGKQEKMRVGNLGSIRDFTDVKDMARAYILLMEKGGVGQVYNIGSGRGVKMKEILKMLTELAQTKIEVESDPQRMRPSDVPIAIANPAKIQALGWKTTITLEKTLERVLNYWRNNT